MDVKLFRASPIGSLTPISGTDQRGKSFSHFAYLPDPLNKEPQLTGATWRTVSRANHALGRLMQGAATPNPAILCQPTLRREAQSTSALEGTFAPLDDVLGADVIGGAVRSGALIEIMNYVTAAERAFQSFTDGHPLSVGLLENLYGTLVLDTPSETDDAGKIRSIQVAVDSVGGSVEDARFIPMQPGTLLRAALGDLVDWIRAGTAQGRDPVVSAAMAHYQFEALHPFNDGNGRIGRLLIVLQMMQDNVISETLLSVSPWFEARRSQYQDGLARVSTHGDWDQWISFFAAGIETSAIDTASRIQALLKVQQEYQAKLIAAGARGIVRDIADYLVGNPYVTVRVLELHTKATYQAASNAVKKLVELGILAPTFRTSQTRFYVATAVREAIVG